MPPRQQLTIALDTFIIDGTWAYLEGGNTNPKRIYRRLLDKGDEPVTYYDGIGAGTAQSGLGLGQGITGAGMESRINEVLNDICNRLCAAISECRPFRINLLGWSRGATAVIHIANELNDSGCRCGDRLLTRIPVNFLGLFDAVDMTAAWSGKTYRPPNVDVVAHAIKTASLIIFPREAIFPTNRLVPGTKFKRPKRVIGYGSAGIGAPGFPIESDETTHGDIGGTDPSYLDPLYWMMGKMREAGINI